MEINQTVIENIPIIEVSGRIDAATSKDLETALNDLIDQNNNKIVIDLAGVEYISSVGLRVMLAALKKVRPSVEENMVSYYERISERFKGGIKVEPSVCILTSGVRCAVSPKS